MQAWRISKASRARDMSGAGAAIAGGRWNDLDVPALYMGLTPSICCLETFVHQAQRPHFPMTITVFDLPDDEDLYLKPDVSTLPVGWDQLPADRPSMNYGTDWLNAGQQLGLIVPSVILPIENNILVNPLHPAMAQVTIRDVLEFTYDDRMFKIRQ